MNPADILPSNPLNQAEVDRIRAYDNVEAFIVIGTTSIDNRYAAQTKNATAAVVLIDETVYALEFGNSGWSVEPLRYNADRHDHLEEALDRLP